MLGAGVLLVLGSPLLALGAVTVWMRSGRPLFFGHARVGQDGRPFRCLKLRTMEIGAEERLEDDPTLGRRYRKNGFKLPADEDPRVVPGTAWLRRSHVDEIPQLLNVLKGDMSLVGPRPVVEDELELFGDDREVLLVRKPGVFGEWTSRGRRRPDYPERARMEVEYVRNAGPHRDLRILARSVLVLLRGQGE